MSIDYSKDVPAPKDPNQHPELLLLVEYLEEAVRKEDQLEAEYKEAKKNRRRLEEVTIPEKLGELGIVGNGSVIRLTDGRKLELSEQNYVQVPAATRPEFYQWLKDNGYGALVKTEEKETVHSGSLRSMIDDLPDRLVKINTVKKVKIK